MLAGLVTTPALAVEAPAGLTMEANVLIDGHARVGSWMAIDIHVANAGPAISGELRLAGGAQGRTRFGTRVDLPTQSDKTYRLYAQPPAFGRELEISLVDGDTTVATTKATFTVHDATQLVVGIVAEQPGDIVGDLDLLPEPEQRRAADRAADRRRTCPTGSRPGASWTASSGRTPIPRGLTTEQLDALRGWVAGGGRLVIVGGTAGPASLSAFPDVLLPYRPTATTDVEPERRSSRSSASCPRRRPTCPALSGELTEGRPLASVRRSHRRGRAGLRQRLGDDRRVRPDRLVDRRYEPGRRHVAPPPADSNERRPDHRRRQPDRVRGHRSCRRSRCRRSAGSSPCWAPTSC